VILVFPNAAFRGEPQDCRALGRYYSEIGVSADVDLMIFQLQDALGGIEFGEEALSTLASVDRVVAIKEATFNFSKYKGTMELFRRLEEESGHHIAFLTGMITSSLRAFSGAAMADSSVRPRRTRPA